MQRKLSTSQFIRKVPHSRFEDDKEVDACYSFGMLLGQGSFGTVHLATHLATNTEWAIKTIDKKKAGTTESRMIEFEIAILKRINHEYIIHLKEVMESAKKTFLVLEYCKGGTLQDKYLTLDGLPAYSPEQVAIIVRRIGSAVAYLHDNDIAHRDLKLDNILLAPTLSDPLIIKVTDFGLCAVKSKDMPQMQMVCGTPSYMAPEVIADTGAYSPLCDIWSTGVILYNLLSGQLPFRPDASQSLEDKIKDAVVVFPQERWSAIDPAATELVQLCLRADPAKRITAKEMLDHCWLSGGQYNPDMSGTVLDMMKAHAFTERLASLQVPGAGGAETETTDASGVGGAGGAGAGGGTGSGRGSSSGIIPATASQSVPGSGTGSVVPFDRSSSTAPNVGLAPKPKVSATTTKKGSAAASTGPSPVPNIGTSKPLPNYMRPTRGAAPPPSQDHRVDPSRITVRLSGSIATTTTAATTTTTTSASDKR